MVLLGDDDDFVGKEDEITDIDVTSGGLRLRKHEQCVKLRVFGGILLTRGEDHGAGTPVRSPQPLI